jgi:predicted dehydrogenase
VEKTNGDGGDLSVKNHIDLLEVGLKRIITYLDKIFLGKIFTSFTPNFNSMTNLVSFVLLVFCFGTITARSSAQAQGTKPLRVGVVGLTHSHVHWILGSPAKGDVEIVGIYEPNRELAERYARQHGFRMDLVYDNLDRMLEATKPEAVTAFGSIFDHLRVVEACAPRGVHVMVEKPLAVNLKHAQAMEALARKHNIHLLTNYETTWYGSNHAAYQMVHGDQAIGAVRKVVVHDGHQGPKEIGVNQEFLEWLTDPVQNGGGALIDFGCYGANLITWLMKGEAPTSVTAVTQQLKPHIYPKVDDEATIVLTYPEAQGVVQASWNWPISRKDMEVYGQTGYVHTVDGTKMRARLTEKKPEEAISAPRRPTPHDDPFAYLAAVVRGKVTVSDTDLSSLPNNVMVVRILDAARESAKSGKTVYLKPKK